MTRADALLTVLCAAAISSAAVQPAASQPGAPQPAAPVLIDVNGHPIAVPRPGPGARGSGLAPGLYVCSQSVAYQMNTVGAVSVTADGQYRGMLAATGTGSAPTRRYLYEPATGRVFFQGGFDSRAGTFGAVTGATYTPAQGGKAAWFKVEYQSEPRDYIHAFDCTREAA